MDLGLKGKNVLITGTNNPLGIGAAAAIAFCEEGARVAMVYRRMALRYDDAKAAVHGIDWYNKHLSGDAAVVERAVRPTGADYLVFEADIRHESDIARAFDMVEKKWGPVDILVNNAAAYDESDSVLTLSREGYDRTYDVNAKGTLFMIQEFVKRHAARRGTFGRIVNLSTDAAQAFAGQIAYGSSKAAVEALTRSIAIEVGRHGITVNAVAPGPTQTGWIDDELEKRIIGGIPLGRIGTPQDIADTILFLCSERASWLTGQVIRVSGGHVL